MTIQATIPARTRDLRIDFTLGLANWLMMLNHIPHDVANWLSLRNFGFSGPTDLFCFASGYGVALSFGGMMVERGFVIAASRIFKRVGQLYGAYLVLFVVYINTISWVAESFAATDLFSQYHISGILVDSIEMLTKGVLLRARPLNLDVLQLAIVILAVFPFILASLLRWPRLTIFTSAALYLVGRRFNLSSPTYLPNDELYLNPFCWQFLFVLGAYVAFYGEGLIAAVRRHRALRLFATAYLALSLIVTVGSNLPPTSSIFWPVPAELIDRGTLGPARILHLLCLASLCSYLVPEDWRGFGSKLLRPILICGSEWLACFCIGIFLSLAAHIVLITNQNTIALQITVSLITLMLLVGAAFYISWSRAEDLISSSHVSRGSTSARTG
jgi:hypothetical protein